MNEINKKAFLVVGLLLVGLVVGGVGGYATGKQFVEQSSLSEAPVSRIDDTPESEPTTNMLLDRYVSVVPELKTFTQAIQAAKFDASLKADGPYTVLAPTDPAFGTMVPGTLETLLLPDNSARLSALLGTHVIAGTYTTADLKAMATTKQTLRTVQGTTLLPTINTAGELGLQDQNSKTVKLVSVDNIAKNGVLHTIDRVIGQ